MGGWTFVGAALAGGLGMYYGIGGAFELVYYRRRREDARAWKCQPRRWLTPRMAREQLLLGTFNMTAGSVGSGLFCAYVAGGGATSIEFSLRPRGLAFAALITVVYFLLTDVSLYWTHRLFHAPLLFRLIHRWHHRFAAPTAFTAAAMHPVEFATYQALALAPLFFLPVHVAGVIAVLVYQNVVALVDHSGVDARSWIPWQPPARFHDDHHAYFHVNFGQTLGIWDRLFGTHRREGRRYGVEVFGGKGEALPGAGAGPAPLVDYGRRTRPPAERLDPAS